MDEVEGEVASVPPEGEVVILRPIAVDAHRAPQSGRPAVPIWTAIQAAQMQKPNACITQVDHARLAGEIARHVAAELFPTLESSMIQAIGLHDEGWDQLDAKGAVRSFLDVPPKDFLRAWQGSITAAGEISELGGVVVGGHFCRLGKARLELAPNTPADAQLLQEFLRAQDHYRQHWQRTAATPNEQVEGLIDFLQFCDVFSLYLCSGAQERVQFPQKLSGTTFQLYRDGEWCVSSPPLFASSIALQVKAWEVSSKGERAKPTTLQFQLR